jgi:hypothetical protein
MNDLVEETGAKVFEIERQADTIIVTPVLDLNEFEFQRIEVGAGPVLQLLEDAHVKNVVMDFHRVDYFGSTALVFSSKSGRGLEKRTGTWPCAMCRIMKRKSSRSRCLTACGPSVHKEERRCGR